MDDSREVITVHLGQCGVQTAEACWELFCDEHNIKCNGEMQENLLNNNENSKANIFFTQTKNGSKYVPRSILLDFDPTVIDDIRNGELKNLFNPTTLISSFEDCANNFARGYGSHGRKLLNTFSDSIRNQVECCNNLQGFIFFHSTGGGTGSGFGALTYSQLSSEFPKKSVVQNCLFPSRTLTNSTVEPYNATLVLNSCIEDTDVSFIQDNEALFHMFSEVKNEEMPSYKNINQILGLLAAGFTSPLRFDGPMNCNLNSFQTNLVPYPRLHFPICFHSPITSKEKANHDIISVDTLTKSSLSADSCLVMCAPQLGKYISCLMLYRGNVAPSDVNIAISQLKKDDAVQFVDWCPTGFKISISKEPPVTTLKSRIPQFDMTLTTIANNSAIGDVFERMIRKFDQLYYKRAFLHWFVGEGMEEAEFDLARQENFNLMFDYEESTSDTEKEKIPS